MKNKLDLLPRSKAEKRQDLKVKILTAIFLAPVLVLWFLIGTTVDACDSWASVPRRVASTLCLLLIAFGLFEAAVYALKGMGWLVNRLSL